jgi:hypothetical protein
MRKEAGFIIVPSWSVKLYAIPEDDHIFLDMERRGDGVSSCRRDKRANLPSML